MITLEQTTARKKFLGASEVPAVLGVDPFRSAYDLWAVRTGRAEPDESTDATERGHLLEPALLEYARRELGCDFERGVMKVHASGLLCANFDGISPAGAGGDPFIVEAKSSTIIDEWGEPGSGEVPVRVAAQACQQFACAGPEYRICWVPVVLPIFRRFEFRMYAVHRDDEAVSLVTGAGCQFMSHNIAKDIPPSGSTPSMEVLKRLERTPGLLVDVADGIVNDWLVMRAARLQAQEDEDAAKQALLIALGQAEGDTRRRVEYPQYSRRQLDVDQLRGEYPEAAKECSYQSPYRVLRPVSKRKGATV